MAVEHTHQGGAAALGEGAGVVAGELGGDAWSEGHHAPAIGPWEVAFCRLRRNKTALASGQASLAETPGAKAITLPRSVRGSWRFAGCGATRRRWRSWDCSS